MVTRDGATGAERRVVLVTGVSRDLGRRFARNLAADPGVARVIGVDAMPPRGDIGDVSFVRADIRNPVIAKVIAKEDVDTVVHMSVIATPGAGGGRGSMKELNVIGTMQLLAACQQAAGVKHLVVKSSTTVYGASSRDPAMFTEDMDPRGAPRTGYAKDVAEVEGYVRGFARRRPEVRVAMLRCANVVGPHVDSPLTNYFRLPVVPTVLGFDPRLQFLHESDLMRVLALTATGDAEGTVNVAGDGVLLLSQALRRLQRPGVPIPGAAMANLASLLRPARLVELPPEQRALLTFGRGVDNSRMRSVLGFEPEFTTAEAFCDFASGLRPTGGRGERMVGALAGRLPEVDERPEATSARLVPLAGGRHG